MTRIGKLIGTGRDRVTMADVPLAHVRLRRCGRHVASSARPRREASGPRLVRGVRTDRDASPSRAGRDGAPRHCSR
jgi:hypothetical protein